MTDSTPWLVPIEAVRRWCDARLIDAWEAAQPEPVTDRDITAALQRQLLVNGVTPTAMAWEISKQYRPAYATEIARHREAHAKRLKAEALKAMRTALTTDLRSGLLTATGYRGRGSSVRLPIPSDLWAALDGFDVLSASATLNGIEWTGILIGERPAATAQPQITQHLHDASRANGARTADSVASVGLTETGSRKDYAWPVHPPAHVESSQAIDPVPSSDAGLVKAEDQKPRRGGVRDPTRLVAEMMRARELIGHGLKERTAIRRAFKELRGKDPAQADIKYCERHIWDATDK